MYARGTNSFDIYGGVSVGGLDADDAPNTQTASGDVVVTNNTPSISWIGVIIALVALRVIYEVAS
jgi:hypothetical protein